MTISNDDTKNKPIPFKLDHDDKLESHIGQLVPEGMNPHADLVYNLLKQGYMFEVGAEFIAELGEDGVYRNAELIGLSLLTHTARKRDNGFNRPNSDKATDKRK